MLYIIFAISFIITNKINRKKIVYCVCNVVTRSNLVSVRAQYSIEFIIIIVVDMINALFIQNMMKSCDRWSFTFDLLILTSFILWKFIIFLFYLLWPLCLLNDLGNCFVSLNKSFFMFYSFSFLRCIPRKMFKPQMNINETE